MRKFIKGCACQNVLKGFLTHVHYSFQLRALSAPSVSTVLQQCCATSKNRSLVLTSNRYFWKTQGHDPGQRSDEGNQIRAAENLCNCVHVQTTKDSWLQNYSITTLSYLLLVLFCDCIWKNVLHSDYSIENLMMHAIHNMQSDSDLLSLTSLYRLTERYHETLEYTWRP